MDKVVNQFENALLSQLNLPIIATSFLEDLAIVKEACRGKLTVLGSLNDIEMCCWSKQETENIVKEAIQKAAPGGGFILSDNHGEIPFHVPDETLIDDNNRNR